MKHSGASYHSRIALMGLRGGRKFGNVRLTAEASYLVESLKGTHYWHSTLGFTPSLEKATEYSLSEAKAIAQTMGGRTLRITTRGNY